MRSSVQVIVSLLYIASPSVLNVTDNTRFNTSAYFSAIVLNSTLQTDMHVTAFHPAIEA